MTQRLLISALVLLLLLGGLTWMVSLGRLPPADFSFCNESEVQSLDPAMVSGQPEGRIIWSVFEPIVQLDPKTRKAKPGVAESWDLSDDGRVYTWHLREDARWSNGEPVTADDLLYSYRRFLDPATGAEYAQAMWYVTNAKKYSQGAKALAPGDAVEIELHEQPEGALPFARGTVLRGELISVDRDAGFEGQEIAEQDYTKRHSFLVALDDGQRRFHVTRSADEPSDHDPCKAIQFDFNEVGIRAPDDHTLITELDSRTQYWPELIGFYAMSPVNRECVERHGSPEWTRAENIVSNGPYNVQFRRIRDRIRLVKSDTYWNKENVAFDVIDAIVAEQPVTQFNLYETGQIDWVPKVPPLIARELMKADPPRQDYNPGSQLATYFYWFNTTQKPYDDPRVRQALVMAIDRAEIVKIIGAGEEPSRSLVPPGIPGYEPMRCPPEDADRARELLAEAGYPEGKGFPRAQILYNSGSDQHETIAELLRKQWQKNLGITVTTRKEEWGTYINSLNRLNYEIGRQGWIGDYNDPNTFLDLLESDNGNNRSGYSSPEYDALIHAAAEEPDPERRMELLQQAEAQIMRDLPVIPIYSYVSRNLVRPNLQGFYNNVQDSHPLHALYRDDNLTGPNNFMEDAKR